MGLSFISSTLGADVKEMIKLPAGSYPPLYRGDEPRILVPGFLLDKTPVTLKEFAEFVRMNPAWARSKVKRLFADTTYLSNWKGDFQIPSDQDPYSPVTYVSWFAARAYCEAYGKRLPTVDEWEYAASLFPADVDYKRKILDWYAEPSSKKLPKVGKGLANSYGVYDLHGLIWEWVEDFNSNLVTGDSRADSDLEQSMFCGAAALGAGDFEEYAAFIRYAFRGSLRASFALRNLGFRCAKSLEDK